MDSGIALILMRSPPHVRYSTLSARVENCGPSMHTTHVSVCSFTARPSSAARRRGSSHALSFGLNGSPNAVCATTLVPSKNDAARTPFVRSSAWLGSAKSPGAISSRSEPTAVNASTARTPSDFRAAMFARLGTVEGETECPRP